MPESYSFEPFVLFPISLTRVRSFGALKQMIDGRQEQGRADGAPAHSVADCGDLPFLIKRDGTWLYKGSPINRKPMVCLFSTVLTRDEEGKYLLETPAERGRIEVEDVPFLAVELEWSGSGRDQVLCFRTNIDKCVTAGPEHPIRMAHDLLSCEPTPYLHVCDGKGRFPIEARINRATYYELVALAEPGFVRGRKVLGVWSKGVFFPLGDLPNSCHEAD